MKKLFFVGILVCFFLSCNGGNDGGNVPSTTSYTYTSDMYVMTITKTISATNIVSMKSIYPNSDYELVKSVLSEGETASYTLKYNGVVVSSGRVLMGTTNATFTPSSGKPQFSGTLSGDTELVISDTVFFDNGTSKVLGNMKKATDQVAAFAEFWGVWKTNIEGTNITLKIGDGVWDIYIGPAEHDIGTYTQTSANTADIFQTNYGFNGAKIGHVVTGQNTTMIITLYDNTAYPGTYHLSR
jgi:hypothetical protein